MAYFSCKGCGSRHPGCHATCEKYIAEKKAWDDMMASHRKEKNIQMGLDAHTFRTIERNAKRYGRQGPSKHGGQ